MKGGLDLGKRSQLSRGGRAAGGLVFSILGIAVVAVDMDPAWMAWVLLSLCVGGLFAVSFWKSEVKDELEEEDSVEVARQAVRTESERLDKKRRELERILMAYGEWMEFPDYEKLQTIDWHDEAHLTADSRVTEILDREADQMLFRFSSGYYWEDGKFETRRFVLDLFTVMEDISKIYQPESEKPILETNLEELLKALNRVSLQIILLLEELPLIDLKEMNIRKLSDNVRKASKVYKKVEEMQPYLEPIKYLWQGSKFLLASNPLLAAGWIAGSELIWKGGKKWGKKAMDAYLLSLVRQSLGILAWETVGIYDKSQRYRSPDWVYGVELAHLLSRFKTEQATMQSAFKEYSELPLRSSYDRIFLYRCVAQNTSPRPKHFAQAELLTAETREQIYAKLISFFEENISANADADDKTTSKWREGLTERLDLGSQGKAVG